MGARLGRAMGIQIPYTERVLAALTALVIAINDANSKGADIEPLTDLTARVAEATPEEVAPLMREKLTGVDALFAESDRIDLMQTNLKDFDTTKLFEVAPWNNRQYACSNCGMYGHTMANKNRPCKGGEY